MTIWNQNFIKGFTASLLMGFATTGSTQDISISTDTDLLSRHQVRLDFGLKGDAHISGFQLDVPYEPATQSPNLDNCLSGLPKSHQGEFAVCNALTDKGIVRVVVMDLGRNRPLPIGKTLGVITFDLAKDASSSAAPTVENVLLAGPDGKPAVVSADQVFEVQVQ